MQESAVDINLGIERAIETHFPIQSNDVENFKNCSVSLVPTWKSLCLIQEPSKLLGLGCLLLQSQSSPLKDMPVYF